MLKCIIALKCSRISEKLTIYFYIWYVVYRLAHSCKICVFISIVIKHDSSLMTTRTYDLNQELVYSKQSEINLNKNG